MLKNRLPTDLKKGAYCIIEPDVTIGKGCVLGHHVVIHSGSIIGDKVRIDDFAVIGRQPMHRSDSKVTCEGMQPGSYIGSGCMIGAYAAIYAGAVLSRDVMVADSAAVREQVTVGEKTVIGRLATIENKTEIGKGCKIETGAYICAFSKIGDGCFVAPCVVTSNDNTLGRGEDREKMYCGVNLDSFAALGAGSVVLPGKKLGKNSIAGAGAVVTKDLCDYEIRVGNPAKPHIKAVN